MISDEAAARSASNAGDRHRVNNTGEPVYAMEPASFKQDGKGRTGRLCQPPDGLWMTSERLTCQGCGQLAAWLGPGERVAGEGWSYRVRCGCGEDLIISPWRLCMVGTIAWWAERGWRIDPGR